MILQDDLTFYDILDIPTTASPQDIREAYLKTKATFNRDSVALYTIITSEEREETLKKIEEAYQILSNPDARRAYDKNYGILKPYEDTLDSGDTPPAEDSSTNESPGASIISIDRVPPMETHQDSESLLIPPSTDFSHTQLSASGILKTPRQNTVPPPPPPTAAPVPVPFSKPTTPPLHRSPSVFPGFRETRTPMPTLDPILFQSVEMETEWRGSFIKKVREAYRISLEEMAGITKVTKTYLSAIEEENYSRLPAPVYIRGFIIQMAKVLKLPHDKVANAYLSRYFRNQKG